MYVNLMKTQEKISIVSKGSNCYIYRAAGTRCYKYDASSSNFIHVFFPIGSYKSKVAPVPEKCNMYRMKRSAKRSVLDLKQWFYHCQARGKICHYCVSGYNMVYSVLLGILPKMTTQQMKKHDEHHWKPLKTIENHWILGTLCLDLFRQRKPHFGSSVQLSHRQLTSGWHSQVASEGHGFSWKKVATLQYPAW